MVRAAGIEPARLRRRILSPMRLPVSPRPRVGVPALPELEDARMQQSGLTQDFLAAIIAEQRTLKPRAVILDLISPFVVVLRSIEAVGEHRVADPASGADIVNAKKGFFRQKMAGRAERCAIRQIVSAIRKQFAIKNVVRINRRGAADDAEMSVALKGQRPESLSIKQPFRHVCLVSLDWVSFRWEMWRAE